MTFHVMRAKSQMRSSGKATCSMTSSLRRNAPPQTPNLQPLQHIQRHCRRRRLRLQRGERRQDSRAPAQQPLTAPPAKKSLTRGKKTGPLGRERGNWCLPKSGCKHGNGAPSHVFHTHRPPATADAGPNWVTDMPGRHALHVRRYGGRHGTCCHDQAVGSALCCTRAWREYRHACRAGAEPRRGPASIADSFWRAPRNDRTDAQTVVDERLIARMDVEYNDDEIGSADEEADVDDGDVHSADGAGARPGWTADDARLQAALAEFRKGHRNGRKVVRAAPTLHATCYVLWVLSWPQLPLQTDRPHPWTRSYEQCSLWLWWLCGGFQPVDAGRALLQLYRFVMRTVGWPWAYHSFCTHAATQDVEGRACCHVTAGRVPVVSGRRMGRPITPGAGCVVRAWGQLNGCAVQAELPLYFKMEGLTAEQLEQLDDETVARVQALAACRRFEAADEAAAERRGDDGPGAGMVRDVRALPPREERWDCESAVTTRSTLYNHPARLGQEGRRPARGQRGGAAAVMLSAKTGLPVERRPDRGGSGVSSEGGSDDGEAGVNLGAGRRKGESGGEKKARKATVKEARRAARQSKKENKRVYAEAGTSMQKHLAANREVHTTVVCLN